MWKYIDEGRYVRMRVQCDFEGMFACRTVDHQGVDTKDVDS
jgi:hypothetical protein